MAFAVLISACKTAPVALLCRRNAITEGVVRFGHSYDTTFLRFGVLLFPRTELREANSSPAFIRQVQRYKKIKRETPTAFGGYKVFRNNSVEYEKMWP